MSRWFVLWCLLTLSSAGLPQSTAPLAQPDLDLWSPGSVNAMVYTADGGRIIGGDFTHVGGLPRRSLARLQPDGIVDPSWSADVAGSVSALAIDSAGRVYLPVAKCNHNHPGDPAMHTAWLALGRIMPNEFCVSVQPYRLFDSIAVSESARGANETKLSRSPLSFLEGVAKNNQGLRSMQPRKPELELTCDLQSSSDWQQHS